MGHAAGHPIIERQRDDMVSFYRIWDGTEGTVVLVVQWLGVGLVIERSLVRLPAGRYQVN